MSSSMQDETLPIASFTDQSMIVHAPTGSDKTKILQAALQRLVHENPVQKNTILYLAPFHAILTQRWKEWKERYEEEYVDYHWISLPDQQTILKNENQVIFSTPDRIDSMIRKDTVHTVLENLHLVFIDEIQFIADKTRGVQLENVLLLLKSIPNIRIIALSATFSNVQQMGKWLSCPSSGIFSFGEEYRPISHSYPLSSSSNILKTKKGSKGKVRPSLNIHVNKARKKPVISKPKIDFSQYAFGSQVSQSQVGQNPPSSFKNNASSSYKKGIEAPRRSSMYPDAGTDTESPFKPYFSMDRHFEKQNDSYGSQQASGSQGFDSSRPYHVFSHGSQQVPSNRSQHVSDHGPQHVSASHGSHPVSKNSIYSKKQYYTATIPETSPYEEDYPPVPKKNRQLFSSRPQDVSVSNGSQQGSINRSQHVSGHGSQHVSDSHGSHQLSKNSIYSKKQYYTTTNPEMSPYKEDYPPVPKTSRQLFDEAFFLS